MAYAVCGFSAIEYYRLNRGASLVDTHVPILRARYALSSASEKSWAERACFYGCTKPVEVLVSSSDARRRHDSIVYHVRSHALPKGAVLENESGVLVCSPELALLQAAERLDFVDLVELAVEFCGTYDPFAGFGREVAPLTSKQAIGRLCEDLEGGSRAAQASSRFGLCCGRKRVSAGDEVLSASLPALQTRRLRAAPAAAQLQNRHSGEAALASWENLLQGRHGMAG